MLQSLTLASPRARGRVAGAVYLLFFLTAVIGALIPPGLTAPVALPTDAAAVASRITGNTTGYELEVAFGIMSTAFYVGLIALLYRLLRPVGATAAVVMGFFGIVGSAITAVENLLQLGPTVVLGGDSYLKVFSPNQLDAIALLVLNIAGDAGGVALVFFGVFQLALGWLIYRSTFLPRAIGVVVAVAGLGWLTYLYPPLAAFLATPLAVLGFAAEFSLMLWLLIAGAAGPTKSGAS